MSYLERFNSTKDMVRSFELKFESVQSGELAFHFIMGKKRICSILKSYFTDKQRDFFEAISDTIDV